jgi:hypothetical protein
MECDVESIRRVMFISVKPCDGRFSDEVQQVLSKNHDRAQWATYKCETCGAAVGAIQDRGKWVPEQHWPSVKYPARYAADKKRSVAPKTAMPDDTSVLAESGSR